MSTAGWFAQNGTGASGAVPPPAAPAAANWFAKNAPGAQQQPQPSPSPAAPTATAAHAPDITQNPSGEGLYQMVGADGQAQGIPYSKVLKAARVGYKFASPDDHAQFAKDYAADPLQEDAVDKFMDSMPWYDPASAAWHALKGVGAGVVKTAAGVDRIVSKASGERTIKPLQEAAATPTRGAMETAGEAGENIGEFFTGEELLGLLGKAGVALTGVDKLKLATQAAQTLNKVPMLAKLARIGESAVRQGGLLGAQTLAKTGGDKEAALESAEGGAALGAAGEAVLPAVSQLAHGAVNAAGKEGASAAGARQFGETARESIRPQLQALQDASAAPRFNISDTLARVGDYTRARQELADALADTSEGINQATGGKFKQLNSEISEAQKQAWKGEPGAQQTYQNKLAEMQDLLKKTPNVDQAVTGALRGGWRQFYVLGDITKGLDRSLEGLPGESATSQAQRGIDGRKLLSSLKTVITTHGRGVVADALGGEPRLRTLEEIGNATKTQAGRGQVNNFVREAARWLPALGGAHAGWAMGGEVGAIVGGVGGKMVGNAAAKIMPEAVERVMNATLANPKVANQILFAVDSGADPKKIGPMLASVISEYEQQQSQEREDTNR